MNIITLNTEENEIHQLQYTNTERFATKSESEFDQHADNIDEQGESHKNDRDEGYLGVELPALVKDAISLLLLPKVIENTERKA